MCKTGFKVIKEEYGNEDSIHLDVRTIPIPGISVRVSSEIGDIQKGKLILNVSLMQDSQLPEPGDLADR
jgi:hypothetical protein